MEQARPLAASLLCGSVKRECVRSQLLWGRGGRRGNPVTCGTRECDQRPGARTASEVCGRPKREPRGDPPTIAGVLIHDRYGLVLTSVAALGAIAAIVSLFRPRILPAVRLYLRLDRKSTRLNS